MPLKILTIDDDPAITELLGFLLGIYGMQVITANDGEQGIHLVRTESPDLVMLDMMMPSMDGWTICRAIRSFSPLPILAYSALSDSKEIDSALEAGVSAYLKKPAPTDELVAQIKKLTSSS
jgi:DNA-binding response OmpR family regulator